MILGSRALKNNTTSIKQHQTIVLELFLMFHPVQDCELDNRALYAPRLQEHALENLDHVLPPPRPLSCYLTGKLWEFHRLVVDP